MTPTPVGQDGSRARRVGPPHPIVIVLGAARAAAVAGLAVAIALAAAAPGAAAPRGAAPDGGCGWSDPVDAPVVDPFRAPEHPYGPGNRGLEYGTEAGQPATAVAGGRVTFVGPVGGRRYVVIEHRHGLRSTYGPLVETAVVRGQQVDAGQQVGAADSGFHLTARLGDRYVDPAPLLAGACGRARLVSRPAGGRAAVPALARVR